MDALLTQSEVRIPGKKRVLLEDSQDEPMDQVHMGKRYKASAQGERITKRVRFSNPTKRSSRYCMSRLHKAKPYDVVDCGVVQQHKTRSFEPVTPAPTADDDDTVVHLKIRDFLDECYHAWEKKSANAAAGLPKQTPATESTVSNSAHDGSGASSSFKVSMRLPDRFKSKETLAQRLRGSRAGLKSAAGRGARKKASDMQKEARDAKFNSKRLTMDQLSDHFDKKASQFLDAKMNMIAANKAHGNNNKCQNTAACSEKQGSQLVRESTLTSIVARLLMSGMTVKEFSAKVQNNQNTPKFTLRPSSLTAAVEKLMQ